MVALHASHTPQTTRSPFAACHFISLNRVLLPAVLQSVFTRHHNLTKSISFLNAVMG